MSETKLLSITTRFFYGKKHFYKRHQPYHHQDQTKAKPHPEA